MQTQSEHSVDRGNDRSVEAVINYPNWESACTISAKGRLVM